MLRRTIHAFALKLDAAVKQVASLGNTHHAALKASLRGLQAAVNGSQPQAAKKGKAADRRVHYKYKGGVYDARYLPYPGATLVQARYDHRHCIPNGRLANGICHECNVCYGVMIFYNVPDT
ncbi:hypothetical protein ABBQ32_001035 [Trebouxia sp. C0010 RCD-2024]